jgi:hypothetical protein
VRLTASVSGLAVLVALWAVLNSPQPLPDRIEILPAQISTERGPRITYPANQKASLSLPDGQLRAVHSVLNTPSRMKFGDYLWNEDGIAEGPAWIMVDLARQTLSVFRADHEIGTTVILFGTDGKSTPLGVFHVLAKARSHRSTSYDAEMPFMLRLTGDGIAIHASNVRKGAATHGCIGVPPAFARLLFDQMHVGDQVAIIAS